MKTIILISLFLFSSINYVLSNSIVSRISDNWNQIKSMSGSFVQTDPDGEISKGIFFFLKPYKSKFEYTNKTENIITNQRLLAIVDSEGYHVDSYPIGNNILKKLLSNEIDVESEFEIRDIIEADNFIVLQVLMDDKTGDNYAKFFFDKNSLILKKWEIYDEFQNKTVLEFTKTKKNISISDNLFKIRYKQN